MNNMIFCTENPKNFIRKPLKLIKEFSKKKKKKKIGTKNLLCSYELLEREIKKTIPFVIASKRIKISRNKLTTEVKHLYTENCKT